MTILDERDFAHVGRKDDTIRADDVKASQEFRDMYEHAAQRGQREDMPFDTRPTGSSSISSITR